MTRAEAERACAPRETDGGGETHTARDRDGQKPREKQRDRVRDTHVRPAVLGL